jgi:hypothetical protein
MSEASREVTPRVFDDLAIRVGMEFDDCSITASAAYHAVSSAFTDSSSETWFATLYKIGEAAEQGQECRVINLGVDLSIGEDSTNLILIQPKAEKRIKQRNGFLRRAVTLKQFVNDGDPILGAQIGEDVVVPLASFAHREESRYCSYVQLGSEMADDTVVMTGLDAGTPRHDVVEAIRLAVDRPWIKFSKDIEEWYAKRVDKDASHSQPSTAIEEIGSALASRLVVVAALQNLLDQQISKHREFLVDAKEALLVRLCAEKFDTNDQTQQINILSEADSSTFEQEMQVAPLLRNTRYENGRRIELVLARAVNQTDQMQILAMTRGDIALPVATLFQESGTLVFENQQWNIPGSRREESVNSLLARVREKPVLADSQWETPKGYALRGSRNRGTHVHSTDLVAADYCYELGLLREDEGAASYRQDGCSFTREALENHYRELKLFFSDPDIMGLPFDCEESPPVELALARLPQLHKAQRAILDTMNIAEQITDKLGECTPEEEILAQRLYSMSQHATEFRAVAKNRDTGKTKADIALEATLSKKASVYDIRIAAKPSTMSNEEFKLFLQYTFDLTQPLFDRGKNTPQQIATKPKELVDLLKILGAP